MEALKTLHYLIIKIFFWCGFCFGFFPFHSTFKGDKVQFTPSSRVLQLISQLIIIGGTTYGAVQIVILMFGSVSEDVMPTNSAAVLIAIYAGQSIAYYLHILAFAFMAAFKRKRIMSILRTISEIHESINSLKMQPKLGESYSCKVLILFSITVSLIGSYFVMLYFRVAEKYGFPVLGMFIIQGLIYCMAMCMFYGVFLYFSYVYDIIILEMQDIKGIVYSLISSGVSVAQFTTKSCSLSDRMDALVQLQMQVHLCIRKVIKVTQVLMLIVIFLTLLSCISSVTDAYIRISLYISNRIRTPRGTLMAMSFLSVAFMQVYYIAQGPQCVLVRHRELVKILNGIYVGKIERRLDRSVSVFLSCNLNFFLRISHFV